MAKQNRARRGWKFTESDFETVKGLLGYKLSHKQIAQATGWGAATVARAATAETYVDYMEVVARYTAKKPVEQALTESVPAIEETEVEEILEPVNEEEAIKMTVNAVERIAVALERMADAWENSPKKKGLFS